MCDKFSTRVSYNKKKGYCGEDNEPVQRVLIPQGLINPSQTTIIEIPLNLRDTPTVIAKPKENSSVRDSQLFPPDSNASAGSSASSRPPVRTRTVIETTRYTEEIPPDNPSNAPASDADGANSNSTSRTGQPKMPLMYDDGNSYGGPQKGYSQYSPGECGVDCSPPCGSFNPYTQREQNQYSSYMNYQPPARSAPNEYAEAQPTDMNYAVERPSPSSCLVKVKKPKPPAEGIYSPYANANDTKAELNDILDHLDKIESSRILNDLKEFQSARRKLIYDASNMKH